MTREERGLRRCPTCGGGEWERGTDHVVVAPVTGEMISFEAADDGGAAWHCTRCQVEAPPPASIHERASSARVLPGRL